MARRDDGAGVVSAFVGAVVFLFFLLFAAHLLVGLYAESAVGAVAYDAAKEMSGAAVVSDEGALAAVAESVRPALGRLGDEAEVDWSVDDDAVRLTVRVPRPAILPGFLPTVRGPIERTVRVRAERVR